jgi:hypothetical protein
MSAGSRQLLATRMVPDCVATAGEAARFAWDEFFQGTVRNRHTRTAYLRAVSPVKQRRNASVAAGVDQRTEGRSTMRAKGVHCDTRPGASRTADWAASSKTRSRRKAWK